MLTDLREGSLNQTFERQGGRIVPVVREGGCTYATIDLSHWDDPEVPADFNALAALERDTLRHHKAALADYDRRLRGV